MIIYGAGGHARVIFESSIAAGKTISGVIDDNRDITNFKGHKVSHHYDPDILSDQSIIIAIGSNAVRKEIAEKIQHRGDKLVDRDAFVADSASLGRGTVVLPKVAVQSEARLGKHVIINTGAIVEHGCHLGDYVHVAPGAVVCGDVVIGEGTLIGANATILPGVHIGAWAVIGAGSVVLRDIGEKECVAGNPAARKNE
jgi:sugar O-acyltransferase (sialic acid O-acetyltransferase NeuD family)